MMLILLGLVTNHKANMFVMLTLQQLTKIPLPPTAHSLLHYQAEGHMMELKYVVKLIN